MPTLNNMDINAENRDKIIALLREGICPICGKKGFKIPLMHIAKIHKINRMELKELLALGQRNGFLSPEYKDKKQKYAQRENIVSRIKNKPKTINKTPNARKAISYAAKKRYSAGLIALNKGNPNIDSIKKAHNKAVIRIDNYGNKTEYINIKEAAKTNNVSLAAISNCLRGKSKTCAGFIWRYKLKDGFKN